MLPPYLTPPRDRVLSGTPEYPDVISGVSRGPLTIVCGSGLLKTIFRTFHHGGLHLSRLLEVSGPYSSLQLFLIKLSLS